MSSSRRSRAKRAGDREHLLLAARQQPGGRAEPRPQLGEQIERVGRVAARGASCRFSRTVSFGNRPRSSGIDTTPWRATRGAGHRSHAARPARSRRDRGDTRPGSAAWWSCPRRCAEQRDDLAARRLEVEVAHDDRWAVPARESRTSSTSVVGHAAPLVGDDVVTEVRRDHVGVGRISPAHPPRSRVRNRGR